MSKSLIFFVVFFNIIFLGKVYAGPEDKAMSLWAKIEACKYRSNDGASEFLTDMNNLSTELVRNRSLVFKGKLLDLKRFFVPMPGQYTKEFKCNNKWRIYTLTGKEKHGDWFQCFAQLSSSDSGLMKIAKKVKACMKKYKR